MSTVTSCISHPAGQRLVVLREDYLALCEGNHCAAALLNFFEHGHNYKLAQQRDALHANEVAETHGDPGTQSTSLLQFHNEESLEDGLLKLYHRQKTIRPALQFLASKGFVTIHKNPNPRYFFDKTHYFMFHPEVVQPQLIDFIDQVKRPDREGQKTSPSGQKTSPIILDYSPEITEERDLFPTVKDLAVNGNGVSFTAEPPTAGGDAGAQKKGKKAITPLASDDWLWQELQHYRTEFDLDALNDDTWWANLGNSFPTFDRKWVPLAFASLAEWLQEVPARRPRSAGGWKKRLRISLNYYYDKHMRRQSYGKATYPQKRY